MPAPCRALDGQDLAREFRIGDVREHAPGIDKDAVSADRGLDHDAGLFQPVSQVFQLADAVIQIIQIGDFGETDGHGFQIPSGQTTVGDGAPSKLMQLD